MEKSQPGFGFERFSKVYSIGHREISLRRNAADEKQT